MDQKQYVFPAVRKILNKLGFKKFEARKELKEAVEMLYASYTGEEDELYEIVAKIRYASLLEEEEEK